MRLVPSENPRTEKGRGLTQTSQDGKVHAKNTAPGARNDGRPMRRLQTERSALATPIAFHFPAHEVQLLLLLKNVTDLLGHGMTEHGTVKNNPDIACRGP